MKHFIIKLIILSTAVISRFVTAGIIYPDPQEGINAAQYGDFYSYSLPVSAYQYSLENGGGVNNGNPFYVPSSPGQIKDLIVIATGAEGQAQTNDAGMDDAYATPNSSGVSEFSTLDNPDPNGAGEFTGDLGNTWDIGIDALMNYLNGEEMYFYFNNNQTNSGDADDQNLFAAGQIFLSGNDGFDDVYFDILNNGGAGPIFGFQGADVANYTSTGAYDWNTFDDFVLSGGQVCTNLDASAFLDCNAEGAVVFNHNLGADQAAYALYSPELMEALNSGNYSSMHVDIKLTGLNNGYEQLFIATNSKINKIPEPVSILLFASGLIMIRLRGFKH